MSVSVSLCWARTFAGRNPSRLRIAGDHVACSYIDERGEPGTPGRHRVVGFDLAGGKRWSVRDFELLGALRDDRWIGVTRAGRLRVLDSRGRGMEGVRDGGRVVQIERVSEIQATAERVVVRTDSEVLVTDGALTLRDRFRAPPEGVGFVVDDDGVLYVERNEIVRGDRRGRIERVCAIPVAQADEAMSRWERETGVAALDGVVVASWDPAETSTPARKMSYALGDRLPFASWIPSRVEATGMLVVSNHTHPHVLVGLGPDFVPRWATYLSAACCGGSPARLPNGELVVSSGCGGIVSWLDRDGRVLRRRTPGDKAALLDSPVQALSDSSCIVKGGPGVVSYDAMGEIRWQWCGDCLCYDYDARNGLLVTASWSVEQHTVTVSCSAYESASPPTAVT